MQDRERIFGDDFVEQAKAVGIVEAACWGHVRRKFFEAARLGAKDPAPPRVVAGIDELFGLEAEAQARDWDPSRGVPADVVVIMPDCGLRPEECFRLRWENIRDGFIEIVHGKTAGARRRAPISRRVAAALELRRAACGDSRWLFPSATRNGHIEPASLKRRRRWACRQAGLEPFPL